MRRSIKAVNVLLGLLVVGITYKLWITEFNRDVNVPRRDPSINFYSPTNYTSNSKPKLILFHRFPWFYELKKRLGHIAFEKCAKHLQGKCELTIDPERFTQAEGVVIYSHGLKEVNELGIPAEKIPGQSWTFFAVESPIYTNNALFGQPRFHRMFNATMGYCMDSEFWHGYVRTAKKKVPSTTEERENDLKNWREIYRKKTKQVAWMVSNCNPQSKRALYVAELKKHIPVDIYGYCGKLKCNDRDRCKRQAAMDYKFYLAFENSLCKDYVTEKLLDVLVSKAFIPVGRSGADYHKLFPEKSVISTADFKSPKELAEFLKKLGDDEEAYIEYLKWNWEYEMKGPDLPFCQVCESLYNPKPNHLYANVYDWWHKGTCHEPTDIHV